MQKTKTPKTKTPKTKTPKPRTTKIGRSEATTLQFPKFAVIANEHGWALQHQGRVIEMGDDARLDDAVVQLIDQLAEEPDAANLSTQAWAVVNDVERLAAAVD